ncbi:MAG: hypothetical protein R3200_13175, partial [Xanthomonadales bacterium]|nr:hypothetical protein [Xanthomonadales bacterium]
MQREAGAVIGGVYSLRERLTALSWLAETPDGAEYVLKFHSAPPARLPDRAVHPVLNRPEWIDDTTSVRPFFPGRTAMDADLPVRRTALSAARRTVEALAALHAAGGVHGNLKPSNLILRGSGAPLLVDATGTGTQQEDTVAVARLIETLLAAQTLSEDLADALAVAGRGALSARELHDVLDDELVGRASRASAAGAGSATAHPEDRPADARREVSPRLVIAVASVLGLLLLLGALMLLPDKDVPSTVVSEPEPAEPAPEPEPEPELTEAQLEALLAQRRHAQQILDEAIAIQLELEEQGVEVWGAEPFAEAMAVLRSGDEPFRNQEYPTAIEIYSDARSRLQAVSELGQSTLAQALADGRSALARGNSNGAAAAFELALTIAPENNQAQAGAARAEILDEAFALRDQASELEETGQLEDALGTLRELERLDPAMPGTEAAIERLSAAIVDQRFRQAMSDGLAAMEIKNWSAATQAFERATKIRPGNPAPAEYLREIEQRARSDIIASHRRKASAAIATENWSEALAHYEAVLKREPKAGFALEGKARVTERLALDRRLET